MGGKRKAEEKAGEQSAGEEVEEEEEEDEENVENEEEEDEEENPKDPETPQKEQATSHKAGSHQETLTPEGPPAPPPKTKPKAKPKAKPKPRAPTSKPPQSPSTSPRRGRWCLSPPSNWMKSKSMGRTVQSTPKESSTGTMTSYRAHQSTTPDPCC